jgi:aerobic carbon-monoxide dehydrogenase medium subunit
MLAASAGEDVQLLAGGTSIMLLGSMGFAEPETVIGLGQIKSLYGIRADEDGNLKVGSMTTLGDIERSPMVALHSPALVETVREVATVRVRNQATIGGNLAHADAAQDAPPMLVALDARVTAVGSAGERQIPVEELSTGYLETSLEPDEIITEVTVSRPSPGSISGYRKFLPRTADDFATVSVAATTRVEAGQLRDVRLVFGSCGPTPIRARRTELALSGVPANAPQIADIVAMAADEISPVADARGSADYKREMAIVWARRLLEDLAGAGR